MNVTDTIREIEKKISSKELQGIAKILDRTYNPFMPDNQIWELLQEIFPNEVEYIIKRIKRKLLGHELVNSLIMKYYPGEKVIKYHFVKHQCNTVLDEVGLFEFNVNNSRIDLGRINGQSFCYEIKSEYDNLVRLEKQLEDYQKAFEYTYLIAHSKHIKQLQKSNKPIPETCGIIEYDYSGETIIFNLLKEADKSSLIEFDIQIASLSSKDFKFILQCLNVNDIPKLKAERENLIRKLCSKESFNSLFKKAVKEKYREKWNYLVTKFDEIQPIDIQSFYKSNAEPYWVYYKNSSMV